MFIKDEFGDEKEETEIDPPPAKQVKLGEEAVDPLDKLDYDESGDEEVAEEQDKMDKRAERFKEQQEEKQQNG